MNGIARQILKDIRPLGSIYRRRHDAVDKYGELKLELASRFSYDIDGYCVGREDFRK